MLRNSAAKCHDGDEFYAVMNEHVPPSSFPTHLATFGCNGSATCSAVSVALETFFWQPFGTIPVQRCSTTSRHLPGKLSRMIGDESVHNRLLLDDTDDVNGEFTPGFLVRRREKKALKGKKKVGARFPLL